MLTQRAEGEGQSFEGSGQEQVGRNIQVPSVSLGSSFCQERRVICHPDCANAKSLLQIK